MELTLKTRAAAVAAAVAVILPLTLAAPASAGTLDGDAPSTCQTLLAGPTPSVEVDTDGDGNPEFRLPSISNVGICVGADVVLSQTPTITREQCGGFGRCMAFYIDYGLSGYAETGAMFCYTIDGREVCGVTDLPRVPLNLISPGRMCVGWDFGGGSPCSNDQLIAFE